MKGHTESEHQRAISPHEHPFFKDYFLDDKWEWIAGGEVVKNGEDFSKIKCLLLDAGYSFVVEKRFFAVFKKKEG